MASGPATSLSDPPFEDTTAQPQLIASSSGSPNPSYLEPIKNTSAPRYNFAKSDVVTKPVSTAFSILAALCCAASRNPSGGPTTTTWKLDCIWWRQTARASSTTERFLVLQFFA